MWEFFTKHPMKWFWATSDQNLPTATFSSTSQRLPLGPLVTRLQPLATSSRFVPSQRTTCGREKSLLAWLTGMIPNPEAGVPSHREHVIGVVVVQELAVDQPFVAGDVNIESAPRCCWHHSTFSFHAAGLFFGPWVRT